ncbi:MAG: LCP family protein [Clostridiales bacterium]|nr:LCP family protein [Clostridiales bacterium]
MSNSSYDVDEILKEVHKRRTENEARIGGEKSPSSGKIQNEEKIKSQAAEIKNENPQENGRNDDFKINENNNFENEAKQEKIIDDKQENQLKRDNLKLNDSSSHIDLMNPLNEKHLDDKNKRKNKKNKKRKTKKSKILLSIILILVILIIGTGAGAYIYINKNLTNATTPTEKTNTTDEWTGMSTLTEDFTPIYEDPASEISSYKNMAKKWYYNGTPVYSSHVLNVLLIGEDTRDEEIADSGTRADSAIIASVNIDTGEITLSSILRDTYCYYEVTEGDEDSGKYGKINGAMSDGGIDYYIRAVENLYKINIDNYVIVNFESFKNIIDKLGGVSVEMTSAEIKEINNHPSRYGNVVINADPGLVDLDGTRALAYCRIRYIDSDNARADRQKTVLLQIFEKTKDASTMKMLNILNSLLPYVKTGYSKSEIVSIGTYALKHGWMGFSTQTCTIPSNETDENGNTITTCRGGNFYGMWCWKVDFPLAAQQLQLKIYGKTNVNLAETRADFSELR